MTVDADDSEHSEVDLITLSTEVVDGEAEIVVNSSEAFSAINTSRSALSCVAIARDGEITDDEVGLTSAGSGNVCFREVSFCWVKETRPKKYLASLVPLRS